MSPDGKQTQQDTNDSPAFRLRPRAEPKSYYTIRLEYSANPAAFTRERPRSAKRRSVSSSHRSSYSRSRNQSGGNSRSSATSQRALIGNRYTLEQSEQLSHVKTKEELEREERRKQLQRNVSQSITKDTPISPFMQRLGLADLRPDTVYEHNYVTLRVMSVEIREQIELSNGNNSNISDSKCLICKCCGENDDHDSLWPNSSSSSANFSCQGKLYVDVHLFNQYADESLIKDDKIINIGKFATGPNLTENQPELKKLKEDPDLVKSKKLDFIVIVRYSDNTKAGDTIDNGYQQKPLVPFISVTDMIEEPTDPYVEAALSPAASLADRQETANIDGKETKTTVSAGLQV